MTRPGVVGAAVGPWRWSLRARLVALTVLLLALISVAIGVLSTLSVRSRLVQQVDDQVSQAAFRAAGGRGLGRGGPQGPELGPGGVSVQVLADGTTSSQVIDPDRAVFSAEGFPQYPRLDAAAESAVAAVAPSATTVAAGPGASPGAALSPTTRDVPGRGPYRLVAVRSATGTVTVVGRPLTSVSDAVGRLVQTEILVAVLGLVVVGVLGWALIRSALRPLTRVAATATRVSEQRLDQGEVVLAARVPEADTDPRTEVGEVGLAINRLLGHVERSLTARHESEMRVRAFVADASHELRTPLTAIRGYAELTRRSGSQVPPDVAYVLGRVESEAGRMTELVEDLLLLARLDAGRPLDRSRVDLSELAVDVLSDAHAAGPDHQWLLDLPPDPVEVTGDAGRLHQVLANLLANARAHTPPGTRVVVAVRRSGPSAVLTVTDDGPGIDRELLPTVFGRFTRGDSSRSRAAGSTGLGLAIVDAVTTAHGGSVAVASRPGRTTFAVTLPADGPSTPGLSPDGPETGAVAAPVGSAGGRRDAAVPR